MCFQILFFTISQTADSIKSLTIIAGVLQCILNAFRYIVLNNDMIEYKEGSLIFALVSIFQLSYYDVNFIVCVFFTCCCLKLVTILNGRIFHRNLQQHICLCQLLCYIHLMFSVFTGLYISLVKSLSTIKESSVNERCLNELLLYLL